MEHIQETFIGGGNVGIVTGTGADGTTNIVMTGGNSSTIFGRTEIKQQL